MSERDWLDAATTIAVDAVTSLDDADFATPSKLANWTNAHIVAHLHFNAEAIGRLVSWAHTGIENSMYSSITQRNADIETGSKLSPRELKHLLAISTRNLVASFDALTPEMWNRNVVTAQGRTVAATELVWMRFREVCVHSIDLNTGLTFKDFPAEAVAKLVQEIATKRLLANEAPALAAVLTGRLDAGPTLGAWL
jgi:uncharacterized protein (TIGR03083 family)